MWGVMARLFAAALVSVLTVYSAVAQQSYRPSYTGPSRAQLAANEQSRIFAQQSFNSRMAASYVRNIAPTTITRVEQSTYYRQPSYVKSYTPASPSRSSASTYSTGRFTGGKSGLQISYEILASVGELNRPSHTADTRVRSTPLFPSPTRQQLQVAEAWKYFVGEGRTRDAAKAVELSRPAAQAGDADAALLLGVAYLKGDAVGQSGQEAFKWISRAAAKNRVAQSLLAELYYSGVGVPVDEAKAISLFAAAADAGHSYAQWRMAQGLMQGYAGAAPDFPRALKYATQAESSLPRAGFEVGFILLTGRPGVPADPQRGAAALERAAKSGDSLSQYLYATCLQAGLGVTKDLPAAIPWLQKAADQRLGMARLRLGEVHAYGLGTPQDRALARKWFELAAADGEPGALNALGVLYSDDTSDPGNLARAIEYFKKAADQNDPAGQLNLGASYLFGRGVPRDDSRALQLLSSAADHGHVMAQYLVGLLYLGGGDVAQNESEGVRRVRQAADRGNSFAIGTLCELSMQGRAGLRMDNPELTKPMQAGIDEKEPACLYVSAIRYERGLLVPQDSSRGLQLLKQSAELNYHFAEWDLGQLYLLGKYLPQDPMQGRYWVQRAADHGNQQAQELLQKAGIR